MESLSYQVDETLIAVKEQRNGNDAEFLITAKTGEAEHRLHEIRHFFESDKVYTDILFYSLKNREYQVIVQRSAYTAFIVHLFQLHLIKAVAWEDEEC
ncbi:hypothetical protein [Sporolactobacillus pectinivorans]|uniref:hypothetical protein n=1 Tax=Sporolactobacillus pectinivorans TaxID=1591408 RepID=UPI000C26589D|nr:hypothetical protein [Sporolactobacillus pectinivorans]